MFIEGFGLTSYRSFGSEIQFVGPCKKINIIIGQNNSGKSNILRFLHDHYHNAIAWARGGNNKLPFSDLDKHFGENTGEIQIAFGLLSDGHQHKKISQNRKLNSENKNVLSQVDMLLQFNEMTRGHDISWFVYESSFGQAANFSKDVIERISLNRSTEHPSTVEALNYRAWATLLSVLGNRTARYHDKEMVEEALPYILKALSPAQLDAPEITLIDAVREIRTDETQDSYNYSGVNIVRELARLERPDVGPSYDELKSRFELINQFVAEVVSKEDVRLEIPESKKTIQVRLDDKTLPLENLGTGIHEVIILAIASTLLQNQVICIEEPEIHLHPLLQKKLIRFLSKKTSNQYFIATHSAAMIDVPDAAVFHVLHDGEQSRVIQALSPRDRFEIAIDLGYRASDILQANCIIWVEGPTDRIYLKHWLEEFDADLMEGVHYSIMFYGGRLLSHLTADDKEVDEFIHLRKINQNLAILIDSDRTYKGQAMNATKRRVRDEFDKGPGFAWVTAGREIENYILPMMMEAAIKEVYPKAIGLVSMGQYDQLYQYKSRSDSLGNKQVDKVKIAREVVKQDADLDVLNLRKQIQETAAFIRQCNDL